MMKFRTKILTTALAAATFALSAQAQVGEPRKNLAIGINGGVNLNTVSFSPTVKQKNQQGMTGGLTLRYISERYFKMICGAQVELNFAQYGWQEFYQDYPSLNYKRTMNYIEVPFLAHLAFGKERGFQFFLHAGPQIAFFLNDSWTKSGDWEHPTKEDGSAAEGIVLESTQHTAAITNKFDYGIAGGAGFELRTRAGCFLLEGRYYYALSDFFGTTKKDYFSRAAHGVITAKLTYLFELKK